jgi:hypothetical protein
VLDALGVLHLPDLALPTGSIFTLSAVAFDAAPGEMAPYYILLNDGFVVRAGDSGKEPANAEQLFLSEVNAEDIEVVSSDPFAGYVLLSNGIIIPFGDAPFLGDMYTLQKGHSTSSRLRLGDDSGLLFDDLNGNGEFDTEDTNGNGRLDVIIGVGGEVILNEDINGNGLIDTDPIVNPDLLSQGFGIDIARDLEVVYATDGTVKGYVILDGYGVLWPFGEDIGAENVRPEVTNAIDVIDIFRSFELIVNEGRIIDYIALNGRGQVFGLPGGPLGAGPATDVNYAGHLTVVMGAVNYGFDIARDIEMNPEDVNADGTVDYHDGFYILDGFGGVHAIGGAEALEDMDFLGFDIARDLEFGAQPLR